MVRLTKKQRVKNIRHNRKLGIVNDDKAISYGSVAKKRHPTLDEYDNVGYEDNTEDLNWGIVDYNNKEVANND